MSSTHTPEPPRPSDRIPNELLVKILLDLPPPTISLHDYYPRVENALFAVSLVSRRFYTVSRGLLWQHLTVESPSTRAALLRLITVVARWQAVARDGTMLHLVSYGFGVEARRPRDWAVVLPGVDRLVARRFDRLELADLARFNNLRHLSLDGCGIVFPPTVVFPRLDSLRLSPSGVTANPAGSALQSFPLLRHLAINEIWIPEDPPVEPVFTNAFLAQLETFEGSQQDGTILSTSPTPYGEHLLFIQDPHSPRWEDFYIAVRRIIERNDHSRLRLRLVLVAGTIWRRPETSMPELEEIEALEGDCERRGIALRTCGLPSEGAVPEFVEFLREEKARTAAAAAARS